MGGAGSKYDRPENIFHSAANNRSFTDIIKQRQVSMGIETFLSKSLFLIFRTTLMSYSGSFLLTNSNNSHHKVSNSLVQDIYRTLSCVLMSCQLYSCNCTDPISQLEKRLVWEKIIIHL